MTSKHTTPHTHSSLVTSLPLSPTPAGSKGSVNLTTSTGAPRAPAQPDPRPVIFFDIDNVLYSKMCGIEGQMKNLIGAYFRRLGLPPDEAKELHHKYYTEYGLAVRGLVRHHRVDPLDYDKECDAALPLDEILAPNPPLQKLLADIDRTKYRVWALTNAYVNHAVRVLSLTGLQDAFEGVVSCDYGAGEFSCKPEKEYFAEALVVCGSPKPEEIYFVDDSALNIKGAHALGWGHCVLFDELGEQLPKLGGLEKIRLDQGAKVSVVTDILDLRKKWPEVFVKSA